MMFTILHYALTKPEDFGKETDGSVNMIIYVLDGSRQSLIKIEKPGAEQMGNIYALLAEKEKA